MLPAKMSGHSLIQFFSLPGSLQPRQRGPRRWTWRDLGISFRILQTQLTMKTVTWLLLIFQRGWAFRKTGYYRLFELLLADTVSLFYSCFFLPSLKTHPCHILFIGDVIIYVLYLHCVYSLLCECTPLLFIFINIYLFIRHNLVLQEWNNHNMRWKSTK